MKREKLDIKDHEILLALIRGESQKAINKRLGFNEKYVSTRLARICKLVGAETVYQLVALEVVSLMEMEDISWLIPDEKALTATA